MWSCRSNNVSNQSVGSLLFCIRLNWIHVLIFSFWNLTSVCWRLPLQHHHSDNWLHLLLTFYLMNEQMAYLLLMFFQSANPSLSATAESLTPHDPVWTCTLITFMPPTHSWQAFQMALVFRMGCGKKKCAFPNIHYLEKYSVMWFVINCEIICDSKQSVEISF